MEEIFMTTKKPSLTELALASKTAMVMGMGGGGDVILTIPLANYLHLLGVETIYIGGVSSQWWNPSGGSSIANFVIGPKVYDVSTLTDVELWAPMVAKVSGKSTAEGHRPAEAAVSEVVPWETFVGGLTQGVAGLRDSLNQVIAERKVDLFIGADIGAHTFHDGKEASPPFTALVSFMTLSTLIQVNCPAIYGFAGYTCDAEMEIEELDERVGRVMRAGGFLGAYGLSQQDVEDFLRASHAFPDPILPLVARAAQGDLGLKKIPVMAPWGRRVYITPSSAVFFFLDPKIMVQEVTKGAEDLMGTRSMPEAEKIYQDVIGLFPETRAKRVVNFVRGED
jgi:hypothetical protein